MFAICIESSHSKGMGHLFRMLNFTKYLKSKNKDFVFIINDNVKTKEILELHKNNFETVNLDDYISDWESKVIKKYNISYWINDRLNTDKRHSLNIIAKKIKLITFDDLGSGAYLSNINVCGLLFHHNILNGAKILKGTNYLILNNEIDKFKKERKKINNILVTLGGSDTYGVTIKVLKILKKYKINATIHIGSSFKHHQELIHELTQAYKLNSFLPSLIQEFTNYDLAITGGGITPFEANASGLPCLIIANEKFEIKNGEFLNSINSSIFLGYYTNIDESIFQKLKTLDIKSMSIKGMNSLNSQAVEKIYKEIQSL